MDQPLARTLLVGTPLGIAQLVHLLELAVPSPQVVGCLVPDPEQTDQDEPAVLGSLSDLTRVLENNRIDQVLVTLPAAMSPQIQQLAEQLTHTGVRWHFLPMLADQLAGRGVVLPNTRLGQTGPTLATGVDPIQLLDRRPHPLDEQAIRHIIADRTIMITGAGGSIGSELARIVCRFSPRRIILLERSENALFEIDRNLKHTHPEIERHALLHDVTDRARTLAVVHTHRPHVIFHAAAHKHVPIMEDHPAQAVENNFYGTRSIADAAHSSGAQRFVMISTDKAVNPSSIMGASKRLAELYVQYLNAKSRTDFCMVRFGNVLGSACSVLPIWSQQLADGDSITVTHPDMQRYFMTIPEAAGLVIQSAALTNADQSGGGEVFLLDMGKPVRILDLARRFILIHGLEPDVDVPIEITGIRPGEKLYEELAYDGEDMMLTRHQSIRIWRTCPPQRAAMERIITTFDRLRDGRSGHPWETTSADAVVNALRVAVPEMVQAAVG